MREWRERELWSVFVTVEDAAAAERAAAALGAECEAVSAGELESDGPWRVEGQVGKEPSRRFRARLEAALALAWAERAEAPPELLCYRLAQRDWLAENLASFAPFGVGRYFICGSYDRKRPPAGRIGLTIDCATAFGSGEHGSTRGCLLTLDALSRHRRRRRILDMGTGTGILAVAAAKTWHRPVMARDIDAESARVARQNARLNGVARLVSARRGDGFRQRGLAEGGFDLILANILARPLIAMAPRLVQALAPGGIAVLAGLVPWQAAAVLAAYRAQRVKLLRRLVVDGWTTLVLARDAGLASSALACLSEAKLE